MNLKQAFLAFLIFTIPTLSFSSRVYGFFPDWRTSQIANFRYKKVTDLVYAFILPTESGAITFDVSNSTFYTGLQNLKTKCSENGVKLHVSSGGWGVSNGQSGDNDPFHLMVNDEQARSLYITNVMKVVEDYSLDGFNLDWEYPGVADEMVLEIFMSEIKSALDNLSNKLGKKLEFSIAVSATSYGAGAFNSSMVSLVDQVMIMAFDNSAADHHSDLSFAEGSIAFWKSIKDTPSEKIILGIPFYSSYNGYNVAYSSLSSSDPATYYNDADGIVGNYRYNSKPVLEDKLNMLANEGGSGIFVWEITQDRTDSYSLLEYIFETLVSANEITLSPLEAKVYPSQFTDEFSVELKKDIGQKASYEIHDVTGRIIQRGELNNGVNLIDASNLKTGIYFVTVTLGTEKRSFKVVKK